MRSNVATSAPPWSWAPTRGCIKSKRTRAKHHRKSGWPSAKSEAHRSTTTSSDVVAYLHITANADAVVIDRPLDQLDLPF